MRTHLLLIQLCSLLHSINCLPNPQAVQAYDPANDYEANARALNAGQTPPAATAAPKPGTKQDPAIKDMMLKPRQCPLVDPNDPVAKARGFDQWKTLDFCKGICGIPSVDDALAKKDPKATTSIACVYWKPDPDIKPNSPPPAFKYDNIDGMSMVVGDCTCNDPILNYIGNTFVDIVAAIGQITTEIWKSAIEMAFTLLPMLIPGVGEAISGPLIATISTAKIAEFAYGAGRLGVSAFKTAMTKAGASTDRMEELFNLARKAPDEFAKGLNLDKLPFKQGSGKAGDKGAPDAPKGNEPAKADPKKDDPKKDDPKKDDPKKEDEDKKKKDDENKKKQQCRRKVKRKDTDDECDETSTFIGKSEAKTEVFTVTCNALNYPQACAHYYSVSKLAKYGASHYTCDNSHTKVHGDAIRNDLKATSAWDDEHDKSKGGWRAYTTDGPYAFLPKGKDEPVERDASCQRDEWPPAYFATPHQAQLVRWLPGSQNTGAAGAWTAFCNSKDGGKGNGAQGAEGEYDEKDIFMIEDKKPTNTKRLQLGKSYMQKSRKVGKKTIYSDYHEASYTRAVFSMKFDFSKMKRGDPSDSNKWYLDENPCWPEAIVPTDPGFCLLNDDPWNLAHPPEKDQPQRPDYAHPPKPEWIANAEKWKRDHASTGDKRGPSNSPGGTPPPQQAPKQGGSPGSHRLRRARRALEINENGLLQARDMDSNSTELLTPGQINENVEITLCEDVTCSRERRALDDEEQGDVLVIPPPQRRSRTSPRENPDVVPTATPESENLVRRRADGYRVETVERRALDANLPAATATTMAR